MTVIKRSRANTSQDLVAAIEKLCPLLENQKEFDAVADLKKASLVIGKAQEGTKEHRAAVDTVIDAFEGDHELMAYTHQRDTDQWTEVEELSQQSSRVINLARRLR
ncbi:MAG: hypothetical protein V4655_02020 [Bdellovibrionota bacterium]|nr:MAG: hypothetical protein EOP10_09640 [Pseudomonadota bacterium]